MRLLSGGAVLLLHALVVLALLLHLYAAKPPVLPSRPMVLVALKPDVTISAPKPVEPARSVLPPAIGLTSPIFTVSPHETRGITLPETPPVTAPGVAAPAGRKTPGDLFSDEKKAEFKRFFKQQAAEDRRENAKAPAGKSPCSAFRDKPGEQAQPDLQASNGITRNFVPAFGVGTASGGSDDDKPSMQACN